MLYLAALLLVTRVRFLTRSAFTILEVAADWQEPMTRRPSTACAAYTHELVTRSADWHWRRIMRPSIARTNEQLDPQCSTQTYHCPHQPH